MPGLMAGRHKTRTIGAAAGADPPARSAVRPFTRAVFHDFYGLVGAFWFFLIEALVFTSCGEGYVKTFALAFPPVNLRWGYQP